MYSKELFEKYPYAFSHYAWTGEVFYDEDTNEPHGLDGCLPKGWAKLFWMCMEEIREPLEKAGLLNKFYFIQVKEKYGELRLYNNGATEEVLNILSKYEYLSNYVCDRCGKPAEIQTLGWIENICKECYDKYPAKIKDDYEEIKLDLKPSLIKFSNGEKVTIKLDYAATWEKYLEEVKNAEKNC